MADSLICKNCGFVGKPDVSNRGTFCLEIVLWLCFVIPGLIYTAWRTSSPSIELCPSCKAPNMIPIDSPAGRKIAAELGVSAPVSSKAESPPDRSGWAILALVLVGAALIVAVITLFTEH